MPKFDDMVCIRLSGNSHQRRKKRRYIQRHSAEIFAYDLIADRNREYYFILYKWSSIPLARHFDYIKLKG